jgi:hypothetical protein
VSNTLSVISPPKTCRIRDLIRAAPLSLVSANVFKARETSWAYAPSSVRSSLIRAHHLLNSYSVSYFRSCTSTLHHDSKKSDPSRTSPVIHNSSFPQSSEDELFLELPSANAFRTSLILPGCVSCQFSSSDVPHNTITDLHAGSPFFAPLPATQFPLSILSSNSPNRERGGCQTKSQRPRRT